jgi:hypothetical protein
LPVHTDLDLLEVLHHDGLAATVLKAVDGEHSVLKAVQKPRYTASHTGGFNALHLLAFLHGPGGDVFGEVL